MYTRLLFAAAVLLVLAACVESPTAPKKVQPGVRSNDEITCRSGYIIATREDGTQTCEPDGGVPTSTATPDTTQTSPPADSTQTSPPADTTLTTTP